MELGYLEINGELPSNMQEINYHYSAFHITWPYLEKALFYAKLFSKLDFALYISSVSSNLANFLRYSHILYNLICFTN